MYAILAAVHPPRGTRSIAPDVLGLRIAEDRLLIAGDAVVTTRQDSAVAALLQPPELRRPPAYFTPDWPAAQRSVTELAALNPAIVASSYGPAIAGLKMEAELATLARRFAELGLPQRGRYPARARAEMGGGGNAPARTGRLPAVGILPPPWRKRAGRTLQLVAALLIWGMSLGWLMRRR